MKKLFTTLLFCCSMALAQAPSPSPKSAQKIDDLRIGHYLQFSAGAILDGNGATLINMQGITLPAQAGHAGQPLVTNGTTPSWVPTIPFSILASTPTTLAGYGILDAQPLDTDLTAIAGLSTTSFGRGALTQADGPTFQSYIGISSNLPKGSITIYHADGTSTQYAPASNTDAARGTVLTAAFAAHLTGEKIGIGPGTFLVAGPLTVLSGVTVAGSGSGVTTIKMADQGSGAFSGAIYIITNGTNYALNGTSVTGILFDSNLAGQSSSTAVIGGVQLYGTNCLIANSRFIHFNSRKVNTECFLGTIGNLQGGGLAGPAYNNKIKNCIAESPGAVVPASGSGVTAFGIFGTSLSGSNVYTPDTDGWHNGAEISGCSAHDITQGSSSGNVGYFHLGGFAWVAGGLFHDNTATNLLPATTDCTGIYTDTGSQFNCLFYGNTFRHVSRGIYIKAASSSHYLFQDNAFFGNFISSSFAAFALEAPSDNKYANNRITNNTLLCDSGVVGIDLTNSTNTTIENNTIDTDFAHPIRDNGGNTVVSQSGNHKIDGTVIVADFLPTTKVWNTSAVSGSDATTTGQTLTDVTGLTFTAAASTYYVVEADLVCTTSSVTSGTEYGINSTGSSPAVMAQITGSLTTSTAGQDYIGANNTADATPFLNTSGQTGMVQIKGIVFSGTGSPVITIRHLKVTSGTSTVKIGSKMRVRPL